MLIVVVSLVAIATAIFSSGCVKGQAPRPEDVKFLGKIHWAAVGGLGYALIILTVPFPWVTQLLAVIVAVTTIWLIRKAKRIRMKCVFCSIAWTLNALIVALAFWPRN